MYVCQRCLDDDFIYCEKCGEWELYDDATDTVDGWRCDYCTNQYYTYCEQCDTYVRKTDYDFDAEMCCDCSEQMDTNDNNE